MIKLRKMTESPLIQHFITKALEYGFTKGDVLWCLRELKRDYMIESRKPGLHPGLVLDILREKAESMKAARRIVNEVCEELGIKTEKI